MALAFGSTTTKVDHGSGASIDDLTTTGFTIWAWVYRTSDGGNMPAMTKRNSNGWHFLLDEVTAGHPGQIRFLVLRTGTGTDFNSGTASTDKVALNTWTFIAATYDDAATPRVKLYQGTLGLLVAETTYGVTTAGTGTPLGDAATNLYVGNLQQVAQAFPGRVGRGGVIARILTLAQIEQLYIASIRAGSPKPHCNVADTKLLFDYQTTTTLTDLSGNANDGVLTDATQADHPLLRPLLAAGGVG